MSDQTRFKIYDASAGSGKTYTLVKEFLTNALSSSAPSNYQSALAITFTNKAVQEMKTRLLEALAQFSDDNILAKPSPLFVELAKTLGMDHHQGSPFRDSDNQSPWVRKPRKDALKPHSIETRSVFYFDFDLDLDLRIAPYRCSEANHPPSDPHRSKCSDWTQALKSLFFSTAASLPVESIQRPHRSAYY